MIIQKHMSAPSNPAFGLVSIIVPVYNLPEACLFAAMQSLVAQTYRDLEVVVVDDGSEAKTAEALANVTKHFKDLKMVVLTNAENCGISHARNLGASYARGDWLAWLDGDDTLDSKCIEILKKNSVNANYVIGECLVRNGSSSQWKSPKTYLDIARSQLGTEHDPFLCNVTSLQPQLISREIFMRLGGFDETYLAAEVTDLFLRYLSREGMEALSFAEGAYYLYSQGRSGNHSGNRQRLLDFRLKALTQYMIRQGVVGRELRYLARDAETGVQRYSLHPIQESRLSCQ